jgi:predicted DCC family thiol-disulfide oxidoreductase YuxK
LKLDSKHTGPILFFDGVCNLCNRSVDFVIRHDKKRKFRFASLQSTSAQKILSDTSIDTRNPRSLVYYKNGKLKEKSNAILAIALVMGFPFALAYVFKILPRFLRNYVYDLIARNRYKWFGQANTCRLPNEEEKSVFLT